MTPREKQAKLTKLMQTLNISKKEAEEIIQEDEEIDHGAKLHELPEELKSPVKGNRERKVDEEKKFLLELLQAPLQSAGAIALEMKTETEVSFTYGENRYTLKLTKHRPPKG